MTGLQKGILLAMVSLGAIVAFVVTRDNTMLYPIMFCLGGLIALPWRSRERHDR